MKKFTISTETRKKAEKRAADLPLLNNSIRKGEGASVAYIGEALILHLKGGEIKDTYDYDVIDRNGVKIDVKTKERKVAHDPITIAPSPTSTLSKNATGMHLLAS